MRFWFEKFRKGDMRDMEHQRQIIDTFVNSVYVFDDRVVLNFNFTDDSKTISREEVLGSSAVENAPPRVPRPFGLGTFFVVGGTGLEQHGHAAGGATNTPVGCLLVRGSQCVGMSIKKDAARPFGQGLFCCVIH